jgi:hypothetical protein
MSPRKKASAYEPEAQYLIKINRIVDGPGGIKLLPPNRNVVKGKFIDDLGDAVDSAEQVPDATL